MYRVNGSQESLPNMNMRRMTQPNLLPPSPDTSTQRSKERSGSPLRHSVTASPRSEDGSPLVDRYDAGSWGYSEEPTSPTLGALARVANSIVSSIKSPSLKPTDDEIEAQAMREREYSRREAERILTREAEERRIMEEKILAMRSNERSSSQTSLPLPSGGDSGHPSGKSDSSGWWKTAKGRLTPTKQLTPAQQIIQEAKDKDKETKKNKGKESKAPTKKISDPSILHLDIPRDGGAYRPGSTSPTRETHDLSRPVSSASHERGPSPAGKSAKVDENPPLYAKFTPQGTLDMPETLLTIARRFEKLERWAVGHVRALEDRVGDVEKWLVDKEEAKQSADEARQRETADIRRMIEETKIKNEDLKRLADESGHSSQRVTREVRQTVKSEIENAVASMKHTSSSGMDKTELQRVNSEISSIKDGLAELKVKMADLGRVSPGASTRAGERTRSPTPVTSHSTGGAFGSTSSRSRLPYPTGDYVSGDGTTPPSSPPPINGRTSAFVSSPSSIPMPSSATVHSSTSTPLNHNSRQQSINLPLPGTSTPRASSTSPTPKNRKRYTVALGGPLNSPLDQLASDFEEANKDAEPVTPANDDSPMGIKLIGSSAFSRDSPSPSHGREETIGGTPIDLSRVGSLSPPGSLSSSNHRGQDGSPGSSRIRAQSAYGAPAGWSSMSKSISTTPPLRPRRRSGDMTGNQAEFGAISGRNASSSGSASKFVDPLVLRKKEKDGTGPPKLPVPRGKASFGELLAFFDGEKKNDS